MTTQTLPRPTEREVAAAKLARIAAEQGTATTSNVEHLLGTGSDLWNSDAELDEFLELIRQR